MEYAHKVQSVRAMLCGVRSQGTVSESNVMWSTHTRYRQREQCYVEYAHKVQSVRAMLCGVRSQGTVSESSVMWSTRTRYS